MNKITTVLLIIFAATIIIITSIYKFHVVEVNPDVQPYTNQLKLLKELDYAR